VALAKQLVYVVALKSTTTEVFFDAGNATGSPLSPVQGSKLNFGCRAAGSVCDVGGDLCWVSTTTLGAVGAIKLTQVQGQVISTPPIDRLLATLDYTNIYSLSMKVAGHVYYIVTSIVSNYTIAFDLTEQAWYIWTDTNGNYLPFVSSTYDSSARPLLQHATDGNTYTCSMLNYVDGASSLIPFSCYTPNFDGGLRVEKNVSVLEVLADKVTTNVNISWSDDDFQTYNTPQPLALNQDRPIIDDGSSFRIRTYLLTHLDSTYLRIKALHLTATPGTF
jgi:hypothetical protein